MKKNNLLWIIMFLAAGIICSITIIACDKDNTTLEWEQIYSDTQTSHGPSDIIDTQDGGYVVSGSHYTLDKFAIMKTDGQGNEIWRKFLDGRGYAIQETPETGFFLKACSQADIYLKKLDADGGLIWEAIHEGSDDEYLKSSNWTADGGCVAGGIRHDTLEADASFVVKLDAAGNVEWKNTYEDTFAQLVRQAKDGGYMMLGETETEKGNQFWVKKLNASGAFLWSKIVHETSATNLLLGNVSMVSRLYYRFHDIKALMDGGFIATGNIESVSISASEMLENHKGAFVMKISEDGDLIWRKSFLGTLGTEASATTWKYANRIVETLGNDYVVTGYSYKPGGHESVLWVAKLSATGTVLLDNRYGTETEEPVSKGTGLAATGDGGFIVAASKSSNDFWVLKFIE